MGAFRVLSVAHNTVERGAAPVRKALAVGDQPLAATWRQRNPPQASIRYELQHAGLPRPPLFPPVCSALKSTEPVRAHSRASVTGGVSGAPPHPGEELTWECAGSWPGGGRLLGAWAPGPGQPCFGGVSQDVSAHGSQLWGSRRLGLVCGRGWARRAGSEGGAEVGQQGCRSSDLVSSGCQPLHFPGASLQHIQGRLPATVEPGHVGGACGSQVATELGWKGLGIAPAGRANPTRTPGPPTAGPPSWCPSGCPSRGRRSSPQGFPQGHLLGDQVATQEPHSTRDSRGLDTEPAMFGPPQVLTIWGHSRGSEGLLAAFPLPHPSPHLPSPLPPAAPQGLAHCVRSSDRGCWPQPTAQRGHLLLPVTDKPPSSRFPQPQAPGPEGPKREVHQLSCTGIPDVLLQLGLGRGAGTVGEGAGTRGGERAQGCGGGQVAPRTSGTPSPTSAQRDGAVLALTSAG